MTITLLIKNIGFVHPVLYVTITLLPMQSLLSNTVIFWKSLVQLPAGKRAVGGQSRLRQADGKDAFEAKVRL